MFRNTWNSNGFGAFPALRGVHFLAHFRVPNLADLANIMVLAALAVVFRQRPWPPRPRARARARPHGSLSLAVLAALPGLSRPLHKYMPSPVETAYSAAVRRERAAGRDGGVGRSWDRARDVECALGVANSQRYSATARYLPVPRGYGLLATEYPCCNPTAAAERGENELGRGQHALSNVTAEGDPYSPLP